MAIFNYKLIINYEFLNQFTPPFLLLRDASKQKGRGKFKGAYASGFTLTELLIVVIIVGIVATLALPMLVKTIEKAKLGEAASNLNLIRTGQKIYFLEYGTFSPTITDLNIENPQDAASRYFDYSIQSANATDFTARAQRNSGPDPYSTYYYDITKSGDISSNGPLQP